MTKATKESWKTKPPPEKKERLGYEALFSDSDADQLMKGLVPLEMEDKWFIYSEDHWLYLYRSWTGALIYWIKLDRSPAGVRVVDSWVNRNPEEYKETDIEYDRQMLNFLIRRFLLDEEVDFPIRREDQNITPKGIYQHHFTWKRTGSHLKY